MITLNDLLVRFDDRPIPYCPGRFVLRAVDETVGARAVVGSASIVTEHAATRARDRVVVIRLEGGGLISYARHDGTWLHTANTSDGFRRKLVDLDMRLPSERGTR